MTRSIRLKLAILALLLALAGARETGWMQRKLGLDGYWLRESARLELELVDAEATLAALQSDRTEAAAVPSRDLLDAEIETVRREVADLSRALAEARSKR